MRLNAKPPWLQKSYSIAKPPGVVEPRPSTELTAAQARVIRNRVARPLVRGAGYQQTHASTFGRRRDEMVQLMHFQTSTWGPKFTVNLGWHPTYVPVGSGLPKRTRWSDLEEHQCTLRGRIGFFLSRELDAWWPFGSDPESFAGTVAEVTVRALAILDQYGEAFGQWCERPAGRLALPPQVVVNHPRKLRVCIDLRHGRLGDAASRLNAAMAETADRSALWQRGLLAIAKQRRAARTAVRGRTETRLEWLTD